MTIPPMQPSAEERLCSARKKAANDWQMNGIYPKCKQDTFDRYERSAVDEAYADGYRAALAQPLDVDTVIVALVCADDYNLNQPSVEENTRRVLAMYRAGTLVHDGDCTKVAHTCLLCRCQDDEKRALAFAEALRAAVKLGEGPRPHSLAV